MKKYDFDIQDGMSGTIGMLHGMIIYHFKHLKRLVIDLAIQFDIAVVT
ncbi:hypothetical protein [Paenibacillus sp. 1001270B_150601_E10]|nr:hypothetical protein [Paenibacillus sp. 1001270B_150601_E10]